MRYEIHYYTDKGIKKSVNQDALYGIRGAYRQKQFCIALISDGMGGIQEGEKISATIVHEIKNNIIPFLQNFIDTQNQNQFYLNIQNLISKINADAITFGNQKNIKIGATLSLLVVIEEKCYLFNIGDSRIYCFNKEIQLLTKDDSLIQQEIDAKIISEEQAFQDKRKNILTACIGVKGDAILKVSTHQMGEDDMYVICSDGFVHLLDINKFYYALKNTNDISQELKNQVTNLMQKGETDNISVMVVKRYG